jgi:hypothetical protein
MKYIAKIERDGLILFFPELRARSGCMVCWTMRHGHEEASTDYYRRLKNPSDADAQSLAVTLQFYELLPPGPLGLVRVYRDSERMYRTRHGFGIEPMADDDSRSYGPHFKGSDHA